MLPTDAKARKDVPVYSGFIKYFPDAIAAVAELSRRGNDQHNPGKPLHRDRSKSGDELDALTRHLIDHASGQEKDTDGVLHATKVAWRAMANLQKMLESRNADTAKAPCAWRPWTGGECPAAETTRVEVELRDGYRAVDLACNWYWKWNTKCIASGDIVAWRLA